jgi:hypothetical protein
MAAAAASSAATVRDAYSVAAGSWLYWERSRGSQQAQQEGTRLQVVEAGRAFRASWDTGSAGEDLVEGSLGSSLVDGLKEQSVLY